MLASAAKQVYASLVPWKEAVRHNTLGRYYQLMCSALPRLLVSLHTSHLWVYLNTGQLESPRRLRRDPEGLVVSDPGELARLKYDRNKIGLVKLDCCLPGQLGKPAMLSKHAF